MKSQIFFVIPREEEKYKECYKYGGKIWHNKLWFRKKKFSEIFKHYKELVEDQRKKYQETSQANKDFLEKLVKELKTSIESQTDPQKKGQMNWFLENFSFKNYKYTYLKWIEKDSGSWKVKDEVFSDWQEREKLLERHDIKFCGEGLTREQITFNYRIPDNVIIKLYNFLFCYNGVWYEVTDHKQVEWDRVEITANYSYYWNDYWYCLNANANGIIHNLPKSLDEVCACPDFTQEEVREKTVFVVTNYELKWNLFSAWGGRSSSFFGARREVSGTYSYNSDFPWFKLGEWYQVQWNDANRESRISGKIAENPKQEHLFSLVSQKYDEKKGFGKDDISSIEAWTDISVNSNGGTTKGSGAIELQNWLNKHYPKEIHHCRANHIEASIQWRDRKILKGNHYNIRNLKIRESSNPSGTVVTFYHGSEAIAEVHESIFVKVGSDQHSNVILNTIISTAAAAAIGAATGGVGTAFAAEAKMTVGAAAKAGAAKWAVAGGMGAAAGGIKERILNYSESTRQEFTIDEFQHKFLRSGYTPVKIVLEHDKEVINRYWANKTIKKGGESNTYFNVANFGGLMDEEGFVKFHFHTLNMHSMVESEESKRWFKDNLQVGVQLIDGDPVPWYQTKLPRSDIQSMGSTTSGDVDTLEVKHFFFFFW